MNSNAVLANNSEFTIKWHASLRLGFEKRSKKTVAAYVKHIGPLRIQRAFYPEEDGTCHVYLLHPPGGLVGGDELQYDIRLNEHSACLITTPGAAKIYRSDCLSKVNQQLSIAAGAILEWLPQESIVFNQAISATNTSLHLEETSQLFFWDVCCLGRPSINERFTQGCFRQNIVLYRSGQAVIIERNRFAGGHEIFDAVWGLQSYYINAIAILTDNNNHGVASYRQVIEYSEKQIIGLTRKNGFIICRYLGNSAEQAKSIFTRLWQHWRAMETHRTSIIPRIWKT